MRWAGWAPRRRLLAALVATVALAGCGSGTSARSAARSVPSVSDAGGVTTNLTSRPPTASAIEPRTRATDTPERSTTTAAPTALSVGLMADTYRMHVTTMTIEADGSGVASWRDREGGPASVANATFHLTRASAGHAQGIVDSSTQPADWPVGQRFELTLGSDDMLVVDPAGIFVPLCGSRARQQWEQGTAPPEVNCGA